MASDKLQVANDKLQVANGKLIGEWRIEGEPSDGTNFGSTANPGIGSQFGQRRTG